MTLVRLVRLRSNVPLLLCQDADPRGVVRGLDAGADDVLPLSCAVPEVLARVRARLRTHRPDAPRELRVADLTLGLDRRVARRNGQLLPLSTTEFRLLVLFAVNADTVLSRQTCEQAVWPDYHGRSNVVDVYVGYLRRRLEAGGAPRLIHSVRGSGYVLRTPDQMPRLQPAPAA